MKNNTVSMMTVQLGSGDQIASFEIIEADAKNRLATQKAIWAKTMRTHEGRT